MLGTFSFEPYFKSYPCFTVRSLKFSDITTQSTFLLPSLLLCSSAAGVSPRRPPLWVAPGPPLALHWPPHVAWKVPAATQAAPLAWCMHATPPRTSSRLPPRRRRGPARTEPAAPFSRAHQNQGALLDLVPSLSRSFPAQTPQTAAAAPPNAGEPQARRRAAPPQPLRPN